MSGRRWLKFWPQDWQRDPALRICCVAARGLWMDLICLAHEGSPYGHVTINGVAATMRQIGRITGTTEKEAIKLIQELEDAGVFSRTEGGVIFSRRMVRDHKASDSGREAIEKRWSGKKVGDDIPNYPPNRVGNSLEAEAEADKKDSVLRTGDTSPPDPKKMLWKEGLATIRVLTNLADGPARRFVGRLLDASHSDHERLLKLVKRCETEQPDSPQAWLMAAAKGLNGHAQPSGLFDDVLPPGVTKEARTGKLVAGGLYLEETAEAACEAARLPLADVRRHWPAVVDWAKADCTKFQITSAIRAVADRPNYVPPHSLKFFDRAVRERRGV